MPIYAYKCSNCGFAKDVLQKMSDAPLSVCPSCGEATYSKQLTAAGFQLKGSGWYVTDFRDGNKGKTADSAKEAKPGEAKPGADAAVPASGSGDAAAPNATPAPAPAPAASSAAAPAPAAAPASSKGD